MRLFSLYTILQNAIYARFRVFIFEPCDALLEDTDVQVAWKTIKRPQMP